MIRDQKLNPFEDHEALEWVAQRGCGFPQPGGQPSKPEWPQPRAQNMFHEGMLAEVLEEKTLAEGNVAKISKGATASISCNVRKPLSGFLQFREFHKHQFRIE